jgi:hypothetical protein
MDYGYIHECGNFYCIVSDGIRIALLMISFTQTQSAYGLDDRGIDVRFLPGQSFVSLSPCPDWLWGPPSLLSIGYCGFLLQMQSGRK